MCGPKNGSPIIIIWVCINVGRLPKDPLEEGEQISLPILGDRVSPHSFGLTQLNPDVHPNTILPCG